MLLPKIPLKHHIKSNRNLNKIKNPKFPLYFRDRNWKIIWAKENGGDEDERTIERKIIGED